MVLRVLHLVGSAVSDFYCDLSRLYASDCLESTADPARYQHLVAYVTPDRCWRFPDDLSRDAISAAPPMSLADAIPQLIAFDVDVMVPQMFCVPGMTSYRALFELLRIPYLGNTPDVMALASAMSRLSNDASARLALEERGRVRTERFTWDQVARDVMTVYEQVATV